jgi:hypothetical protein
MKWLLLLFAFLMVSCVSGPKTYNVKNSIVSSQDYNLIVHRATEYLSSAGFVINTIDKQNGMINAEGDALALQESSFSDWSGVNVKYLLADCGKLSGNRNFADKVKLTVKITQSANGNDVRMSVIFNRTIGNAFPCSSTGQLEKQFMHYIETGEIMPFDEYKTDAQKRREHLKKEVDEKKKK